MLVITGFLVTSFVVSFTVVDCVPTLCAPCVVIVSSVEYVVPGGFFSLIGFGLEKYSGMSLLSMDP